MNKYTELSDFEINKKVAEKLGAEWFVTTTVWDELVAMVGNKCFKPCNNPTDAMPIIIGNKIGMNFIGNIVGWSASHICESKGELEVYDKNYYRAAMMCFLIMKDAENEG
ncbi:phage recombination protein [Proteus vulgaris]|uniref:Phage recombination protein n=1 Tax=Proteus vulgaris TaxID=585 RepID=A0A379F4C8_PROVU|nr:phage protein NinX family protein [Proteus vulgaris]SUC14460.1 phage recombination protein [Proteus vulgaris]